ncbi:MAG: ParA family protein [Candidatus Saccharimonadales bacterium]
MEKKQTIIAVLNQKGGVGKTTTTINVAAYLAKQKRRVLIVDADPQGNATSGVGVNKTQLELTLCDVLVSAANLTKVLLTTNFDNIDIVPTNARLASVELDLATVANREQQLKKALAAATDYDYVLIDCPPALGLLTINALTAADQILIPVQAEYYALEGLSQLLQVMRQVQANFNPDLELLGVVMTMYDKRTSLSEQVYSEVKKHFGEKLLNTVIPRNVRLAEAPSHGKPIADYDRWSKGARAYKSLASEIDTRIKGKA